MLMPTIITSFIASIQKALGTGQTYNPYASYSASKSASNYTRPSSWQTYGTYTGSAGIMQTIRQSFATGQRKIYILGSIASVLLVYILWIYGFVVQELPDLTIEGLQRLNFSQTSTITDKNDKVLYKFYEENREFVDYSAINPMMVNAIIAIEDQTFWTNAGVDFKGIVRAFYSTAK
jgi:membrane peptidoglycan carboxypeptidase